MHHRNNGDNDKEHHRQGIGIAKLIVVEGILIDQEPQGSGRPIWSTLGQGVNQVKGCQTGFHGRYCCIARKPKCFECVVADVCNWPDRFEFGASKTIATKDLS